MNENIAEPESFERGAQILIRTMQIDAEQLFRFQKQVIIEIMSYID